MLSLVALARDLPDHITKSVNTWKQTVMHYLKDDPQLSLFYAYSQYFKITSKGRSLFCSILFMFVY